MDQIKVAFRALPCGLMRTIMARRDGCVPVFCALATSIVDPLSVRLAHRLGDEVCPVRQISLALLRSVNGTDEFIQQQQLYFLEANSRLYMRNV